MAENLGKWPFKRGPMSNIRPSDGCERETVPLAVAWWYDLYESGWHLGNVGTYSGCGWQPDRHGSMIRSFSTLFSPEQLKAYHNGVMTYKYRDIWCLKSPIDVAIYIRLIHDQAPGSIFEIGSMLGGSALLFRDITRMFDFPCEIVSIDLNPPAIGPGTDGIRFLAGDANDLEAVFAANSLLHSPRPWLVIEDNGHTFKACTAVLDFCSHKLLPGEYLVMEDGVIDDLGLYGVLPTEKYDGGPNRAIKKFLTENPGIFEIDEFYCDMFGQNATYNPNGYLQKT